MGCPKRSCIAGKFRECNIVTNRAFKVFAFNTAIGKGNGFLGKCQLKIDKIILVMECTENRIGDRFNFVGLSGRI